MRQAFGVVIGLTAFTIPLILPGGSAAELAVDGVPSLRATGATEARRVASATGAASTELVSPSGKRVALVHRGDQPAIAATSRITVRLADGTTTQIDVYDGATLDIASVLGAASDPAPSSRAQLDFALLPTRSNPFRGSVTLRFQLPEPGRARLDVHDVAGRRVATPFDQDTDAGAHTALFSRPDLGAGLYFARLSFIAHGSTVTRRANQTLVKLD